MPRAARRQCATKRRRDRAWATLIGGLCLPCLLLPAPASSTELRGLYQVYMPVADETEATRANGLRQAMRVALLRLTGSRRAMSAGQTQEFLREAERYVLRYRYEAASATDANQPSSLQLVVLFNQAELDQRLREMGLAIWGRHRPAVLIWLAVNDDSGQHMLGADDASSYALALRRQARTRGIDLIYPLLDIEDNEMIQLSDVRGGFAEPVLRASHRYSADVIYYGLLEQLGEALWRVRWHTVRDGQLKTQWSNEGEHATALLEEGIDQLTDELAEYYLRPTDGTRGEQLLTVTVHNVKDLTQYSAVLAHLQVLNSVVDVRVTQLDGDHASFALRSVGGKEEVRQAIALGRVLKAMPDSTGLEYTLRDVSRAE